MPPTTQLVPAINVEQGKQGFQRRLSRAPELDLGRHLDDMGEMFRSRTSRLVDRLAAINEALVALNRRRLVLSVDCSLPDGVVRCVDCGRFVSEMQMAHSCPFPRLVDSGMDPETARRLATAGFDSDHEVATWATTIEQLGPEAAGLWKAAGVSPIDARRLASSGVDPADMYLTASNVTATDPLGALADARTDSLGRFGTLLDARDIDGCVDELTAHGRRIAAVIDERVAVRRQAITEELAVIAERFGLDDDQIARVIASNDLGWVFHEASAIRNAHSPSAHGLGEHDQQVAYRMLSGRELDEYMVVTPAVTEYMDAHAAEYRRGDAMWSAAHELSAKSREANGVRAEETIAVLRTLRPFGGDLGSKMTQTVAPTVNAAIQMLPSDWIDASRTAGPLKIESVRGNGRASYCHNAPGKRSTTTERSPFVAERKSFRLMSYQMSNGDPTEEEIEAFVRARHPEAFDGAVFQRQGKTRGRKALWSSRTRNISNISFDPETRTISFDCETEKVTQTVSRGERTSMITVSAGSPRTAVHEFGHRMENTVPQLQRLATRWRDRRTEGMSQTRIVGCGSREWGYQDGFATHYIGKTYPTGDTEVISVGLESVLLGTHGGLAGDGGERPDEDHRAFMLGILSIGGTKP